MTREKSKQCPWEVTWGMFLGDKSIWLLPLNALEKEMATYSSVLAWRIPGMGSLMGCRLWGRTESEMTEAT